MQRMKELARDYFDGKITIKEFRSRSIVHFSKLDDVSTIKLAELLLRD